MANEIKKVIDELDDASSYFEKVVAKSEKKIFDEAVTLIKDLELDSNGNVKQTIANLKRLGTIKAKLEKVANSKEYLAGVSGFVDYFSALEKEQSKYFTQAFAEKTLGETAKKKHAIMKQIAVNNTITGLTGAGLQANVTDKLNDILLRAVTSNAKFADLQEEMRAHLLGKDGGQGALARYANTYAVTAISQFTGNNNKLMTDDLGCEWFMYVGSNIETTRDFCEHMTRKRYIHRSEIKDILKGHIHYDGEDHQCAIYSKTGLPYGMIEGTNEDNLQVNCGGWNCRHQMVPVADAVVPKELRDAIEKKEPEKKEEHVVDQKQQENLNKIEQYVKDHPKSTKFADYLQHLKEQQAAGNSNEFEQIMKAALKDMQKFNAAAKVQANKKEAAQKEAAFNDALKPIQDEINNIHQYTIDHPKSQKLKDYYNDIQDLIANKNVADIPAIHAIADAAIKDIKKFDAAAKSKQKQQEVPDTTAPDSKQNNGISAADKKAAEKAVQDTIKAWLQKYNYADWDSAPANHKKAKLEWEISILTKNKKYATWQIAVNAYQKLLKEVEEEIKYQDIKTKYYDLKNYKAKSKKYDTLLAEAEKLIASGNYSKATIKLAEAEAIQDKEKAQANKNKSKIKPSANENKTPQNGHRQGTSDPVDAIMADTGCAKKEAEDYNNAVYGFTYQWDYEIRQIQCGNSVTSYHGHTQAEIEKRAQDIENYISKAPKWNGGVTYRGMSLSPKEKDDLLRKLKAGIADMKGTASWSTMEAKAKSFSRAHIGETSPEFGDRKSEKVVLKCAKQKNATSIKHLSEYPSENEVVTSMGNRYQYVNEKIDGDYFVIEVKCK